jgi:hypothetical protein
MGKLVPFNRSALALERRRPQGSRSDSPSANRRGDRDLLPMWVALWVGSALRVASALVSHEVFGAEATLALAAFLLVPGLMLWRSS